MPTQTQPVPGRQVPTHKFAKVGQTRERKKGGLAAWFKRVTGRDLPGFGGNSAAGGGGVWGKLAAKLAMTSGTRILITGVAALCCMTAWGIGHHLAASNPPYGAHRKKLFAAGAASKERADSAKLPRNISRGSGLDMISGGPGSDPAAAAATDAAAKADGAGAAGAAAAAPQVPGMGIDAAAIAAAAAAKAQGAGDGDKAKKAGAAALGSALGGLGKTGATGSAGAAGPAGQGPNLGAAAQSGKLSGAFAAGSNPARTSALLSPKAINKGRGLAASQLLATNKLSGLANTQSGDASATTASTPFDGNPGSAQAIGGVGSSLGGPSSGQGSGGGDFGPPPGGGSGGQPTVGGGPAPGSTGPDNCAAMFPGQSYTNNANGACVNPVTPTNTTPWQSMVDLAEILLAIASALLTAATVIALLARGSGPYAGMMMTVAQTLAKIAAACAAIATLCGIGILLMGGDKTQGGLITAFGAIITVVACIVAFAPESNDSSSQMSSASDQASTTESNSLAGQQWAGPDSVGPDFSGTNFSPGGDMGGFGTGAPEVPPSAVA